MKRVSIIGLGWLGLPLAQHLQQKGFVVKGSKRDPNGCPIACYPFDLSEFDAVDLAPLLDCDSLVINLPPSGCPPEVYVAGIRWLIETAVHQHVTHIVFVSSSSVLPMRSGEFDEQTEPQASSPATQALIELEHVVARLPQHSDVLRLAGLVGQQRHPVYALAGKVGLGGAEQPVNLVHLQDCINAIELLIRRPNGHRLFHLCSRQHPTRQAYYSEMARRLRLPPLQFLAENQPLVRIIQAEKICRELGFVYQFDDPYQFPFIPR